MPVIETKGAASSQGFGEFSKAAGGAPVYIEDVFSTWLYTGTGSSQTITNGIDLSTKGGLVWFKNRSAAFEHHLYDTARGATKRLKTTNIDPEDVVSNGLTAFGTTGFTVGANTEINGSGSLVSWTFRKQPKFFDIVSYTGNGVSGRQIAHNLGSAPGCMIIKRTDNTSYGPVYHRSLGYTTGGIIYSTGAFSTSYGVWGGADPTSTVFTVDNGVFVNANGGTYVAYLFAHNAGGFGATGTDNVISCGSAVCDSNGFFTASVGFEPQWVLVKSATVSSDWQVVDTMRGMTVGTGYPTPSPGPGSTLFPNTSGAETTNNYTAKPMANGFEFFNGSSSQTYIYIAIRRGPMKRPTSGTSVFSAISSSVNGTLTSCDSTLNGPDAVWYKARTTSAAPTMANRLANASGKYLDTSDTGAEINNSLSFIDGQSIVRILDRNGQSGISTIQYYWKRAPGFFDVVCYTGTGSNTTQAHNLGAVPELIIVKRRGTTGAWSAYSAALANTEYLVLNTTAAKVTGATYWNSTTPTSSVFSLGTAADVNASTASNTYVAYLFASCPGVSKVGSYTGNGSSQTINCGFTAGARFILIKRTDSTGDWYVWDTARGIVSANDPHLSLNTTAVEVTTNDSVDPGNTGFIVNQVAATNINVNAATYIFLAIA